MAFVVSSSTPSFISSASTSSSSPSKSKTHYPSSVSFSNLSNRAHHRHLTTLRLLQSSYQPDAVPESDSDATNETTPLTVSDEWGEKTEPGEAEREPATKMATSDPPRYEDEWGENDEAFSGAGNGSAAAAKTAPEWEDRVGDLKRCLVDSVYGTEFGFRAGSDVRAEVLELVSQLEALNPTPSPVQATAVLDGSWVLVYTASSELLPLLAAGSTPFLKVQKITQKIDTSSFTIENSITLSSPFASFSFSASASFEVRSPSRIQVQFKEGTLQPPEIKSTIDLPQDLDVFGQNINLSLVQQTLSPLQDAAASIARTISGQPPLKVRIPGERTQSWLITTYLDEDLRISRGDGGLFVLVKEGSPLQGL